MLFFFCHEVDEIPCNVYFVVGTVEDSLDLVGNVSRDGATLVKYVCLSGSVDVRRVRGH